MLTPLHMHALEHFVTLCPLEGRLRATFSTHGLPLSQFGPSESRPGGHFVTREKGPLSKRTI